MKRLIKYAILIFTIVFVIAFCIAVIYPYMLKKSGMQLKTNNNIKKPQMESNSDYTIKTYELPSNLYKNFIYPTNSFRDPFHKASVPVSTKPSQYSPNEPSVTLTGIIWGRDKSVAIIKDLTNNKVYVAKTGQEIGKVKIIEIKQRSVVIKKGDEMSELLVGVVEGKLR